MAGTQSFRDEHAALLGHVEHLRELAGRLPEMTSEQRADAVGKALGFLRGTLIPHAEAEEEVLYPAVAKLLGDPEATATMISDHRAIVARIDSLESAGPDELQVLQELLYGLYALVIVHFHKEEDDYLPLLEKLPAEELDSVFERMGEHGHDHTD